ncbi:hypothetical protein H5410_027364 [Solanum commersonii]|uniref:G-patch domain-containing protein n=1 Tax=Solanum commersonii TaxID=4109 RepID=A0A9J5Z1M5_SOLCO|nr:hypothetical protein H5410_027364 [Solanum commersonii]
MVTLDDEYECSDYPNINEVDAMISSLELVITFPLKESLTVQIYIVRGVVTTLIARNPEYDSRAIPWEYREDRATFHTWETMQAVRVNEEAEKDDTNYSCKSGLGPMILKYGYQPKSGLGPKSNEIVEQVQLKHHRSTNGLRDEPTS